MAFKKMELNDLNTSHVAWISIKLKYGSREGGEGSQSSISTHEAQQCRGEKDCLQRCIG